MKLQISLFEPQWESSALQSNIFRPTHLSQCPRKRLLNLKAVELHGDNIRVHNCTWGKETEERLNRNRQPQCIPPASGFFWLLNTLTSLMKLFVERAFDLLHMWKVRSDIAQIEDLNQVESSHTSKWWIHTSVQDLSSYVWLIKCALQLWNRWLHQYKSHIFHWEYDMDSNLFIHFLYS